MPTTVTAVNPPNCSVNGGELIEVSGTQFAAGARVTFGGRAASEVQVIAADRISCKAPKVDRARKVDVVVTNKNGNAGTGPALFEYWAILDKVEPGTGAAAGGTQVTLTGKGFPENATVQIGGVDAGVVNRSASKIVCTTAAHAPGPGHVYVYNPLGMGGGRRNAFRFSAPAVTGLEPPAVPSAGGVDVTIRGDFFAAGATVTFGGTPSDGPPNVVSAQEIRAKAPAHAPGQVDVVVTVAGNATTLSAGFEYQGAKITSVEPRRGPAGGGTDITILGERFDTVNPVAVRVGGVAVQNLHVVDATRITARTQAAGPGKVDVTVQNQGHPVVTLAQGFEMVAAPTLTKVVPPRGAPGGGTAITVTGTNFAPDATVTVGGAPATEVKVVSPTTITATTAAHVAGTEAVAVTNPGAPAVSLDASFTFSGIERIEPARGLPAGNEQVVIHGSGFGGAVTVRFGHTAALAVVVDSPRQLTVTTPGHAAGTVDVVVGSDAGDATFAGGFTFSPITAVEPPDGPTAGNTEVVLRGDGIPEGPIVYFGARPAARIHRVSAQELRVLNRDAAAGPVDIRVRGGGFDEIVARGFTYRAPATVAAIDPPHGPTGGGTAVTITGTGFVEGATVTIGNSVAAGVRVVSETTITATTALGPPPPPGGLRPAYDVTVTNPRGAPVTAAGLFRYRDRPRVDTVAPAQGPTTGDRWITVSGRDYVEGAVVMVDGDNAIETTFVDAQTLHARVPAHPAGPVQIAVRNPDEVAGDAKIDGFTYATDPTETGGNQVTFILDGENYFEELRVRFEEVRRSAPHELTYVRLAYWMIEEDVTLGDHTYFHQPNHRLLVYIDQLIRAGHNVDVILWCPSKHHRFQMGAEMAEVNGKFGRAVYDVDRAAAAAGPHVGRARAFLEPYEGEVGASNHQKIAIFSIAGVRTAYVGGLNLSNHYFAPADHSGGMTWHDAAVRLRGPVTDDVEKEWMRRWKRTDKVAEYWGWNAVGWGGELLARDFSFWNSQVVRHRAVRAPENTTRQPHHADDRTVKVALTRSVGSDRMRQLRDEVIARINAATQSIYFENYHFADPELVRAVVARQQDRAAQGTNLQVVIMVPMQGGASGYMTRRAWLHMAFGFRSLANEPIWTTLWYDLGDGAGERQVDRANCVNSSVHDTYDPDTPWTTLNRWIDGDHVRFRLNGGAIDVNVPLDKITRVDVPFHFYTCYADPGGNIYKHSKIAIFDDRWLVCGTANWSYRSMQYDGEIATFTNSQAVAQGALHALLDHYNPVIPGGLPAVRCNNIEAEARANLRADLGADPVRLGNMGNRFLVPICAHDGPGELHLPRDKPGVKESPNFTWY